MSQPSTSRHLPRAGMAASPHSLDVPAAMGLDLFPKYNSLESLIYLAFDIVDSQAVRYELRNGQAAAKEIMVKLETILQANDVFAVGSEELAKKVYEELDEKTTELCPLFQFVISVTQQFYMHIGGEAAAKTIEEIVSFGIGSPYSPNSQIDDEALEGLPQAEVVSDILANNRWLVPLILFSLRPIAAVELAAEPPKQNQ